MQEQFFSKLEKTHLTEAEKNARRNVIHRFYHYAIKASVNYSNIITISGTLAPFVYGTDLSLKSGLAFGGTILSAFLAQRALNEVNKDVRKREHTFDRLSAEFNQHELLYDKVLNANLIFNSQRYKTRMNLLMQDASSKENALAAENKSLKQQLVNLQKENSEYKSGLQNQNLFKPHTKLRINAARNSMHYLSNSKTP